ncbi:putative agmatinase 1 precursor [Podospora aff. communis PSN243]|uniref:Agmatinase 1 n=1 Tax=Podospora aff. communis PSN243 TaxID=3040156 RepID=A0AAV9G1V2_9PEZI|nr:putative agmatinase 1 precursor [Podospora aff. communis PSN243]
MHLSLIWLLSALAVVSAQQKQIPMEDPVTSGFEAKFEETPWGLSTYANVPYFPCRSRSQDGEYDIAILGAPFDTGTTGRPGARFGPRGIRTGSSRIYARAAWNVYTGENVFRSDARIVDCGDAPLTFLDNTVALKQIERAHKAIAAKRPANKKLSPIPRVVVLGGDHTTTLPALRAAHKNWGKLSVIHFDVHIDTWEPKAIGTDITDYSAVNHGTFLHIAHEEGLLTNTSIHAGIRAPLAHPVKDVENDRRCGFEFITARDFDRVGATGVIQRLKDRVGDTLVYISVDIDVLDPAYAPATGTSEPGGWTTRELLTILDGLTGLKVVGADVVEVAPAYDNVGETTGLAAAEIVQSLLYLMLKSPLAA